MIITMTFNPLPNNDDQHMLNIHNKAVDLYLFAQAMKELAHDIRKEGIDTNTILDRIYDELADKELNNLLSE
ncbi:MAG: hypothetical protein MJ156_00310 [Alphaproteobacteria bacterium]|nr:hypothetical protein [Alphaproteobacteria bacterium]